MSIPAVPDPFDDMTGTEPPAEQFGSVHQPPAAPGRRALQLPTGRWVDGWEPGYETRRTRARRIAAARHGPDPLGPDPVLARMFGSRTGVLRAERPARPEAVSHVAGHNGHRDRLARQLDGIVEVTMGRDRADAMTATTVFEVKPRKDLWKGAQKAAAYSGRCGLAPAVAVYGTIHRDELLAYYQELRARAYVGLRAATRVELWWWTGIRWSHISARSRCLNVPAGCSFGTCPYCGSRVVWLAQDSGPRICTDYGRAADGARHHCDELCSARHLDDENCLTGLLNLAAYGRSPNGRVAGRR